MSNFRRRILPGACLPPTPRLALTVHQVLRLLMLLLLLRSRTMRK